MFGRRLTIFKLFGFEVRIDLSWFILAVLITWSLAVGLFPLYLKNLSQSTYWWMGVAGAAGLFVSIIFHELWHSLIARRYGLPMKGITLFIFGGVAEMEDEPPSPRAEFLMAIAGPISSILLGVVFYGIRAAARAAGWPAAVNGVFGYLAWINLILAGFNLLPAFPLDGGRVLRSVLWNWRGELRWATRIASQIGSGFGIVLIILGVLNVLRANFVGGIWMFMIGMFLRNASQLSYRQVLLRNALEGDHVRRFMEVNSVTVPASVSIAQLVEDYIYKYHFKMLPVVDGERLLGCIGTRQVQTIPRNEWGEHRVGELVRACSSENTIAPDADAIRALSVMQRTGNSRLMVVERDRLVGIIALKDMLQFLALKLDLEGDGE
jgi:Zn-dependent protease/predicted transcriptional regulator